MTLPNYWIFKLHKLGHGSFATPVWLARDMSPLDFPPGRFLAPKITVADLLDNSHEARILKLVAENSAADSANLKGSQHIRVPGLLDNFKNEGPYGTHQVLVTEILASLNLSELERYLIYIKATQNLILTSLRVER